MKKLFNWIESWAPVSKKKYEADLALEKEKHKAAIKLVETQFDQKQRETVARIDELVSRLSRVQWVPETQWSTYRIQLDISAEMLRATTIDRREQSYIADALGQRVASDIRSMKFIQH